MIGGLEKEYEGGVTWKGGVMGIGTSGMDVVDGDVVDDGGTDGAS